MRWKRHLSVARLSEMMQEQQSEHSQLYLSIIMPMFNEQVVIGQTLSKIIVSLGEQVNGRFEILVVDDGSSNDSAAQVLQVAHPAVRLIQHPYNIGNGAAVKTGIRHAQGEYILLMDADGQHKPEDIPRLLEQAQKYDLVVGGGSR